MFDYTFEGHLGLTYHEVLNNPKQKFLFQKTINRLEEYFDALECENHHKELTASFICRDHQFFFSGFSTCCQDLENKLLRPKKPFWVIPFIDRTNRRLKYTDLHLKEIIKSRAASNSGDLEDALHESFLFHLVGVIDAFYQELNIYYDLGLAIDSVDLGKIIKTLNAKGVVCPEIKEIEKLRQDEKSWLGKATILRNHITHRTNPPRNIHLFVGGDHPSTGIYYRNPKTWETHEEESLDFFQTCNRKINFLINELRDSAIWNNINLG